MSSFYQHVQTLQRLLRLPVADLRFEREIAPDNILDTYRNFTRRHPKYKLIQHKSWGAALLDLHRCPTPDDYLDRIKARNWGGFHARRARGRGYVVREINMNAHIDAIHAINTSLTERQGRPMDTAYLHKQTRFELLPNFRYFGVLDAQDQLMAYATVGHYGNFSGFSQLMGYRNNDGVMHLLVVDIAARLITEKRVDYLMYDTFFGALPGLRQFKSILGFSPYRARYSLL